MLDVPFYSDWKFWSFASSAIAIVLSQIPPLRDLLKPAKLEIDVHSRILIHHKIGNPNANLFLTMINSGGRTIKVKKITLAFQRDNKEIFSLAGQGYFQKMSDSESSLFTPFRLIKGQEWAHSIQFFVPFSRADEKSYRKLESEIRSNIGYKRSTLVDSKHDIPADEEFVKPLMEFFSKKFDWMPGEYQVDLRVEVEPQKASKSNTFRFTIYESDSNDLRDVSEDYKFGAGVFYHAPHHNGISFMLTSQEG